VAPKVRVMELVNQTITAEKVVEFNSREHRWKQILYDDLLKGRHVRSAPRFDNSRCLRFL
jgi:hypothetical protein